MNVGEPTAESLVRARDWFCDEEHVIIFGDEETLDGIYASLATLLDTIREEERERAAKVCDRLANDERAIFEGKDQHPFERSTIALRYHIAFESAAKAIRSGA
jgi:hypothetical protein